MANVQQLMDQMIAHDLKLAYSRGYTAEKRRRLAMGDACYHQPARVAALDEQQKARHALYEKFRLQNFRVARALAEGDDATVRAYC